MDSWHRPLLLNFSYICNTDYIINSITKSICPKYQLTPFGKNELESNGYIPYMHAHKRKTTEDNRFGEPFNIWSINREFQDGDARNWREVVGKIEKRMFGMDIVNSAAIKKPTFTSQSIRQFLQARKEFISNQAKMPGDGFSEEMKGIELKKAGKDDEALVQFYIVIEKQFDAPALYTQAAILLRKYKLYDLEVEVLKAGIKNVPRENKKHWQKLKERLEKAKALAFENRS